MSSGVGWAAMSSWSWIGLIIVILFWVLVPLAIYLLVSRTPSPRSADDDATWDWIAHNHLFAEDSAADPPAGGDAPRVRPT